MVKRNIICIFAHKKIMIPIFFAPLQGYTEDAYRRFHHQLYGGVERYYTPFVRIEHGSVRSKDKRDVRPEFNLGVPVVPQLIASDASELRLLLNEVLPLGYKEIDINMGCPFPLQTKHGRGAGLLAHPDKVTEICQLIKSHPEVTFSVKMRLGLDDKSQWQNILPILNSTPLRHITLHPRIATQQYKGSVDMDEFEAFLTASQHPVVYNGDVRSIEEIQALETRYPQLSGIMIGRGLLARPSLAAEYSTGKEWSQSDQWQTLKQMHTLMKEHYEKVIPGESQQLQKLRTFWDYLEPQDNDPSPLLIRKQWKKIKKAGNMKNYLSAILSAL